MRTLGHLLLAAQVEGATAPPNALSGGFLDLIKESSLISQLVLAILVIFSIVSYAFFLVASSTSRDCKIRDHPRIAFKGERSS